VAAGCGLAALVLLLGLYAARNLIAREALLGWLHARGVPAQADIGGLGLGGVTGRIVVGPPEHPDFSVESSEIGYGLSGFWNGERLGLQIRSVRLVRPVLNGSLHGSTLSFGALDPLIAELRKRPPPPNARQPQVVVEGGRLLLATDYGRADLHADAVLNDGRLLRLEARLAPARLAVGGTVADLGASSLSLTTRGDRVDVRLDAAATRLASPQAVLEGARLQLTGQAPYPDLKRRRGDGALSLRVTASADKLQSGAAHGTAARLTAAFDGRVEGWIDTLSLAGSGGADATADAVDFQDLHVRSAQAKLAARTLAWSRASHELSAEGRLDGSAASLAQGALRLATVQAGFQGNGVFGPAGRRLSGVGGASAKGAVTGLGAPASTDAAEVAAIKRALAGFTVTAPGVKFDLAGGQLAVVLPAPIRLQAASGVQAVLAGPPGRPAFEGGAGAFGLAIQGGGAPAVQASVSGLRFGPGGLTAPLRLTVHSNFDPVRDGVAAAAGTLRIAGGKVEFAARDCAQLQAQRLEFRDNDVMGPKGELCPTAEPMFRYADGSWRVRGRIAKGGATLPFLQAGLAEARGAATFGMTGGALSAEVNLERARLDDLASPLRFYPVRLGGPAILREGVWQAALVVADAAGRRLGEGQLSHDTRSGVGELDFESGALAFEEGGLQPAALSPLAAAVGSPVRGHAGFSGSYSWSAAGLNSQGTLTVPSLDFVSPLGAVSGLQGEVAFSSLAPLQAEPGQRLRAAAIAAFAPVTHAELSFGLGPEVLKIEGGEAQVGGGRVRLAPISLPFAPGAAWSGVVEVENVQVSDIIKASPFGDRVSLDAKLTGRVPFSVTPAGLRVAAGRLVAAAPGRLSIRREALTGVVSSGGEAPPAPPAATAAAPATPAAPTDAFSDFAYQAMENLAFDDLSAEINSLPEGRIGVLFHIKGKSDPPKRQVLKVGVGDLINRSFLNRPQPLPSGTKVDLTLDTSLNLDQLLGDFAGYQKLHSSAPVQASGPKPAPTSAEKTQ
jgi:hypothetical protein